MICPTRSCSAWSAGSRRSRRLRASCPPCAAWPSVAGSRAAAAPAALRRPEDRIDRGALRGRRERPDDVQVHRAPSVARARPAPQLRSGRCALRRRGHRCNDIARSDRPIAAVASAPRSSATPLADVSQSDRRRRSMQHQRRTRRGAAPSRRSALALALALATAFAGLTPARAVAAASCRPGSASCSRPTAPAALARGIATFDAAPDRRARRGASRALGLCVQRMQQPAARARLRAGRRRCRPRSRPASRRRLPGRADRALRHGLRERDGRRRAPRRRA